MINRIKQWDFKNFKINDKSIINFSLFLSIFALVLSIPSGTPCLSANECQVGSDATFTNDVNIKSGTNYNLTLGHNYAQNVIANFEEVGGNHTGSVILKDNSGDMNLNGGLVLGTSATSTNGTIRWNGSEVQVYNSGWAGVGGADQNVFTTISGNSGSLTASTTTTSIKLEASADSGLTVVASGDKLEIQSSGGGGDADCPYYAYLNSSYQPSNPNGAKLDTELYDPSNCFTLSSASSGSTFTYTNATTRVFNFYYQISFDSSQGNHYVASAIAVGRNQPGSPTNFGENFHQLKATSNQNTTTNNASSTICLEQNKEFALEFPVWTNSTDLYGGRALTYLMANEIPELSAVAQSNGCTNGLID